MKYQDNPLTIHLLFVYTLEASIKSNMVYVNSQIGHYHSIHVTELKVKDHNKSYSKSFVTKRY